MGFLRPLRSDIEYKVSKIVLANGEEITDTSVMFLDGFLAVKSHDEDELPIFYNISYVRMICDIEAVKNEPSKQKVRLF